MFKEIGPKDDEASSKDDLACLVETVTRRERGDVLVGNAATNP